MVFRKIITYKNSMYPIKGFRPLLRKSLHQDILENFLLHFICAFYLLSRLYGFVFLAWQKTQVHSLIFALFSLPFHQHRKTCIACMITLCLTFFSCQVLELRVGKSLSGPIGPGTITSNDGPFGCPILHTDTNS